jgi:hypothetical protein
MTSFILKADKPAMCSLINNIIDVRTSPCLLQQEKRRSKQGDRGTRASDKVQRQRHAFGAHQKAREGGSGVIGPRRKGDGIVGGGIIFPVQK